MFALKKSKNCFLRFKISLLMSDEHTFHTQFGRIHQDLDCDNSAHYSATNSHLASQIAHKSSNASFTITVALAVAVARYKSGIASSIPSFTTLLTTPSIANIAK